MARVKARWENQQPEEWRCALCGKPAQWNDPLDRHHVFGGARRRMSEEDGLVVLLHHYTCHEGPQGVHRNAQTAAKLHRAAEKAWLRYDESRTVQDFILRYGKNYI